MPVSKLCAEGPSSCPSLVLGGLNSERTAVGKVVWGLVRELVPGFVTVLLNN